jgi:alanine racemase (EC 5.1.1.1)
MENVFFRPTWAEIDLDAIRENVQAIRRLLPDQTEIMAVVKADGYGHGAYETAISALEAGAKMLAVALLEEGIVLRKKGIDVPILVLGYCPPEYAGVAESYQISLTVYQAGWLEKAVSFIKNRLPVHIKCDTGMGRIGIRDVEELDQLLGVLRETEKFEVEGIFTHFAKADSRDEAYYFYQLDRFRNFLKHLDRRPKWIHASNSAGALLHREGLFNLVRIGIAMYGLSPSEDIKDLLPIPLREAFSLHSRLVHVKQVEKGSKIGYGCTYEAKDDEWIGTVPIGYADGWLRRLQGHTVLIDGRRAPIVGRICMDQCMVRLPGPYPVGTPVTLIGKMGDDRISVDEIADRLGTINYEVVCLIRDRVPRVYKKGGSPVKMVNSLLNDFQLFPSSGGKP